MSSSSRSRGLHRRLLAVLAMVGIASVLCLTSPAFAGAAASATGCTAGTNPSGQTVYYCGVWLPSGGIPVYANTSAGSTVVDHLHTGGTANWFYCQESGGTASTSGYTSSDWARTIGDDHGATGYVPAVYFSGTANSWTGLPACGGSSSPGGTTCTSGTSHTGDSVFYCPIWVPSGGVPIYSSTSTTSTVVDHLHTAGDGNWFYCQQNGSSATASGYTSSNWAKTIGDDNGATGYVPAVYFTGAANYWAGVSACGSSAPPPSDGSCDAGTNGSGQSVYYCPVWLPSGGVPVYSTTSTTSGVVGTLNTGGSANWFYCHHSGSTATTSGYSSTDWAYTLADNNAKGYVPAIYFSGAQNYWPGLPTCAGTPAPPSSPPTNGGAPINGSACGYSFTSLPTLTMKLIENMCAITVPSNAIYQYRIYSWDGGHGSTPGPTYGSCSPSNGAPNDCHVDGFDCSGLVRYAYYETTGLDALDGYTWQQWTQANALHPNTVLSAGAAGKSAQVDDYLSTLKPGDILFYGNNADEHVAVYLGNGKQMNAYQSGDPDGVTGVTTDDVFWGAVQLW